MKLFQEDTEYRRERNRTTKYGGWRGMLLYIALLLLLIYILTHIDSSAISLLVSFFKGGKT